MEHDASDHPRLGFSGAYTAIADDSGTAFLNPAGITTLAKSELSASVLAAQPGTVGLDRFGPWTGLAAGSGAARLSKKTAIACYFVRPRAGRIELSPARLPDGSIDAGYLDATVTDVGAAVARRVAEWLSVGVSVTATHLGLEGLRRHSTAGDRLELETGSAAGDTRVTASLGILYEAGSTMRLAARCGSAWSCDQARLIRLSAPPAGRAWAASIKARCTS